MDKENVAGVPLRLPTDSELEFFKTRLDVGGYAADDNSVVLNPFANLTEQQKQAVSLNEAARIYMRTNPQLSPNFSLSDQQTQRLSTTDYAKATQHDRRATIAARLLTNDPSGGEATDEQRRFVEVLREAMGLNQRTLIMKGR